LAIAVGREVGQSLESALRESVLDHDVLALDPPELAKPLPECLDEMVVGARHAGGEKAHAIDLPPRAARRRPAPRENGHG